jgi:glycosyltransferase involved in cell wall biosynthesis
MASVRVIHAHTGGGLRGGIAAYIGLLCRNQKFATFEYIVACSDSQACEAKELYGTTKQYHLPETYTVSTLPRFVRHLVEACRNHKCQCIHAHALRVATASVIAGAIVRVPVIYTNHGLRFSQKKTWWSRLVFFAWEAVVCSVTKRVVCIRQSDFDLLNTLMPWLGNKTCLIRTRIDGHSGANVVITEPPNPLLLGVGSLLPVKNPRLFIQWVKKCKESNLEFTAKWLGDGPLRSECIDITKRALLPIEWPGQATRVQVREEMLRASLLLITSEYESMPLAALEAMSVGLPIVVSPFRGVNDFVEDKATGLIIDSSDAESAAERIAALLSDKTLRTKMADNARRRFTELFCDSSQMVDEYEALYRELAH